MLLLRTKPNHQGNPERHLPRQKETTPLIKRRIWVAHDRARLVYQFYTLQRLHIFTHKSWARLVVHHTSLGEMTSKLTTRPLQRILLVRNNREGWIGDHVAGLEGVKNTTDEAT